MEHAGGEAGEGGAPEMEPHAVARSLSTPSKPSPGLYLDLLLLQDILEVKWINWKVTKTISIPFFHLKCVKWSTPAEKAEKVEPRKWAHGPLAAAPSTRAGGQDYVSSLTNSLKRCNTFAYGRVAN